MRYFNCQPEVQVELLEMWLELQEGERRADLSEFAPIDKSEAWLAEAVIHTLIRPVDGQWEVALLFADPLDARHFVLVPFFTVACLTEACQRSKQLVGHNPYPFSLSVVDLFDSWN